MKLPRRPAALVVFVLALAQTAAVQAAAPTAKEIAQGYSDRTFLAKPRANTGGSPSSPGVQALSVPHDIALAALTASEQSSGVILRRSFSENGDLRVLEAPAHEDAATAIARLRASGNYEFVEPDYIRHKHATPTDPSFANGSQWSLRNTGQFNGLSGADIRATQAWDLQSSAANVIVAVIDSGLRVTHEDLAGNLWRNPGEIAGNGIDDDGNGFIDDINGINSNLGSNVPGNGTPTDLSNHGTGVASVIGATGNNSLGMTGVAWRVQLMPLRFLDADGYGYVSGEVTCLNYAIDKGAKIINGSFGGGPFSQSELSAIRRARDAGIIVVVSAGNESFDNDAGDAYPANYLLDNIVAVASTTRIDTLSDFSDFGGGMVELAAPGSSIYLASSAGNQSYTTESGTSFSAPMVTGALALLKERYPNDSYRALINRLLRGTQPLPALAGKVATGGRLDLNGALSVTDTRPFNDDFASATVLTGEDIAARSVSELGTRETSEPTHANVAGGASLWWTWTATRSGTVNLDTRNSAFDTLLAVYTGNSVSTLTAVASNDNESGSLTTSKLSFTAVAGTTYRIAVDGKAGAKGLAVLHLALLSVNDNFASAAPVSGRSFSIRASNSGATREVGEPRIKGVAGGHSVWFRWTAPATRRYYVASFTFTTGLDTMIGVYTGNSVSALTEVASSLSAGNGEASIFDGGVAFTAVAGQTYYFAVDGETSTTGNFGLSLVDSEWEFFGKLGGFNTPAVSLDGTICAVDAFGYLYAINRDGTVKWTSDLESLATTSAPAIGADGVIYVGDSGKYINAFNPDGTLKWYYLTGGIVYSSPAVAADGTIYVRSDDNLLYALTPAGAKKWSAAINGSTSYASPAIAPDGTIYCGSGDGKIFAFNPDGTSKWSLNLGTSAIFATPAIAAAGTVYIGVIGNKFHAVNPNGTLKWSLDVTGEVSSSAAIGADGSLYFGCADGTIYALSPAGAVRWTFLAGGAIRNCSPTVASDGTIYLGALDGLIYALNADGSLRRTYGTADEVRASPLLYNGRLYFSSGDYRLYAVETGQVPASTPWPMLRQNIRRTSRATPQALAIGVAPQGQVVSVNASATFSVGAVGTAPLSYQWRFNGTPILGATGLTYTLDPVTLAHAGQYSVTITDANGSITSGGAPLAVSAPASGTARLSNLATRAPVGTGGDILIPGITVAGSGTKQILIRAAGPALAAFNVAGVLARPQLRLFRGQTEIANNATWGNNAALKAAFDQVGAFQFDPNSNDAALLADVSAGGYTAQVSGVGNTTGVALVEVYEIDGANARLSNLASRARVGTGADILIPGITISGTGAKQLLIRAAGPALKTFNVAGVLEQPRLELYSGSVKIAENLGWSTAGNATEVAATAATVGAFAFTPGTADCAILITLSPGGYTVQVSGVGGTTGVALVEVYEVP